jgi:hypothetical protein
MGTEFVIEVGAADVKDGEEITEWPPFAVIPDNDDDDEDDDDDVISINDADPPSTPLPTLFMISCFVPEPNPKNACV